MRRRGGGAPCGRPRQEAAEIERAADPGVYDASGLRARLSRGCHNSGVVRSGYHHLLEEARAIGEDTEALAIRTLYPGWRPPTHGRSPLSRLFDRHLHGVAAG